MKNRDRELNLIPDNELCTSENIKWVFEYERQR